MNGSPPPDPAPARSTPARDFVGLYMALLEGSVNGPDDLDGIARRN